MLNFFDSIDLQQGLGLDHDHGLVLVLVPVPLLIDVAPLEEKLLQDGEVPLADDLWTLELQVVDWAGNQW